MRSRILLPIILFFLLRSFLGAQTFGALAGKVTDPAGTPLGGAVVEVLKTSPRLGSYARNDGSYKVLRLRPGTYAVLAQVPPYRQRDTFAVTIKAGATATLDIKFEPRKTGVRPDADGNTGMKPAPMPDGTYATDLKVADGSGASGGDDFRYSTAAPMSVSAPAGRVRSGHAKDDKSGRGARSTTVVRSSDAGGTLASGKITTLAAVDGEEDALDVTTDRIGSGLERKESVATSGETPTDEKSPVIAQPLQQPGQLTAGEWSDLDNWPFWLDVAADPGWSKMLGYWGFDPASRVTVRLVDGARPVIDAEVRLVNGQGQVLWNARSDNRGRAELFAGMRGAKGEYRVEVKAHGEFVSAGMVTSGSPPLVVKLPGAAVQRDEFDLMFVVDATGSMGDEMSYIKAELESVINRNREATNEDLKLRLSCNFYRDVSDEYLVRPFDFSESTFDIIGHLRDQVADGGGDTPEAVEDGLEDAIEKHAWSPNARARLMFLVLDAPPHYTPERCEKIRALTARAAAKGIRIIPIASSGIDKETEFLLRMLGMYTGGTYCFLTDDSGIGGSHIKPTVGPYKVEFLNDLMVRVISRYLAVDNLSAEEGGGMELN